MSFLKNWWMQRGAEADARSGLDSIEERIVANLGPRPKVDSSTNAEHADLVTTLANHTRVEELREDVAREEDAFAHHASPALLTLGLVVAIAIEVLGAILIMRVLGVRPAERLPLGLALALALIGITAVTANRASARRPATNGLGGKQAEAAAPRRSAWTLVLLLAYSLFVGAITVVRIQSSTDEDASRVEIVAQSLLLLATAVGPAWMAEFLLRRRAPAVAIKRRLVTLRKRLRGAERAHERARKTVNQIAREGARWDAEAARRRAFYVTHHRLAHAKGTK